MGKSPLGPTGPLGGVVVVVGLVVTELVGVVVVGVDVIELVGVVVVVSVLVNVVVGVLNVDVGVVVGVVRHGIKAFANFITKVIPFNISADSHVN